MEFLKLNKPNVFGIVVVTIAQIRAVAIAIVAIGKIKIFRIRENAVQ